LAASGAIGIAPTAEAAGFSDYELGEFYPLSAIDEADATIIQTASEAVVRFPNATGFIVDPDGLILTNHHVYEGFGASGTVWRRWTGDGSEEALSVELVSKDVEHDVALYRVVLAADASPRSTPFPFIELRTTPVHPGERVFVLGHPSGDPLQVSFGKVLAEGLTIAGRPSIEYSAQTWWGSSGSPVLDASGRGVAIHWGWDSTGISNGRLTGVPTTKFTAVAGFDDLGRLDPRPSPAAGACDPAGWSLSSTLIDAGVKRNAGGRWLDQVELRPVHDDPRCEATLDAVSFHLHPSFQTPDVAVGGGEVLTLYSWGFFDTTVELAFADGRTLEFVDRVIWK
jgi:hypothetical protein